MLEEPVLSGNELLLGIDLGTSRTAVISNRGFKKLTYSVVGYPKDIIGIKLLGDTQVFGEEALARRSALTLYTPLEDGVIREYSERDYNAAQELLRHVVKEARHEFSGPVCGVIGVPARASVLNKELLFRISQNILDVALVVSEPFMVAYAMDRLANCIIVDIGAGTIDICGMKGTVPAPDDQVTLLKAGNYIDDRLESAIIQRYPDIQVTRNIIRKVKEQHAFVGEPMEPVLATFRLDGRPAQYDITTEMRTVCESIVPDIIEHLATIIAGFDPEDQQEALMNIFLAGGGSHIRNIDRMIADQLAEYGDVRVQLVEDPEFIGAAGALKMAMDLPPKYWEKVGFLGAR